MNYGGTFGAGRAETRANHKSNPERCSSQTRASRKSYLEEYLHGFPKQTATDILNLLSTLTQNIIRSPDVLKYRQIRETNKRCQLLFQAPGGPDALRIIGWQQRNDLFVLPEDAVPDLPFYLEAIEDSKTWFQQEEQGMAHQEKREMLEKPEMEKRSQHGKEKKGIASLQLRLKNAFSAAAHNGHLRSCLLAVTGNEAGCTCAEARELAKTSIQKAVDNAGVVLAEKAILDTKTQTKDQPSIPKEQPKRIDSSDILTSFDLSAGEFGFTIAAVMKPKAEPNRATISTYETNSEKVFACKCTLKQKAILSQRVNNMHVEKQVLTRMSHPFVIKLLGWDQDSSYLYLVTEKWEACNLKHHLKKTGKFHDERARFYSASIILALRYIHKAGIVYRNLDLESVIMFSSGYVKLGDFSVAKFVSPDRQELQVFDTMPEVVLRGRSGFAETPADLLPKDTHVDWWMLGILIYEMIVGTPPVADAAAEDKRDYVNTWNGKRAIHIPRYFHTPARSLMKKLLHLQLDDADVIMRESWFVGFDFKELEMQEMPAPWRPLKESDLFSEKLRHEPFKSPRKPGNDHVLSNEGWFKEW